VDAHLTFRPDRPWRLRYELEHLCHRRRCPHRHGPLLGSLKDFSATDLGGIAIKGALEKAGITGDQVDYVIMGHVLQAGCGQVTARQAAVKGGIPMDVPAITDQQGVPVGHQRDRHRRPAHPLGRV
jgi:hypothetical protein